MACNINADTSWVTIKRLEEELSAIKEKLEAAEQSNIELTAAFNRAICGETHMGEPVSNNYRDAYEGAREDLLLWKRRAESAEKCIRESHEQEPAAYVKYVVGDFPQFIPVIAGRVRTKEDLSQCEKLYTMPPIPPELAELQRKIKLLEEQIGK